MVVTMLAARVSKDQVAGLIDDFGGAGDALPPFIVESFLVHDAEGDMWKIVTVWASQDDLDEYRASVETPEGVRMFRSAGAEPTLTIFDVAAHAAHS
jgi:heme-degrading monooxygenase HmoA